MKIREYKIAWGITLVVLTGLLAACTPASTEPVCFTTYLNPVSFTPDSARILVRADSVVQVFDLETMAEASFLQAPTNLNTPAVALSPDGERLAWALEDYSIQVVALSDKKVLHTLVGHTDVILKLRFTPGGDKLVSASNDGWVRVWDDQGQQVHAFQPGGGEVLGIGLSPDGTLLATIPFDGPVTLWDLSDYHQTLALGGTGGFATSDVAFSPDGQYVAADLATGLYVWSVVNPEPLWGGVNSMAFAFSPDGQYLAYADIDDNNNIVIASPDGSQRLHVLSGHQGSVWELFFSPDATLLASAGGDETLIWQVADGRLLYVGKTACP